MELSRTVRLCSLGVILTGIGLSGWALNPQNNDKPSLTHQINDITDQVMDASKALAVERGLTTGLIANPFIKKKGQVETIKAMRDESSVAFTKLGKSLDMIKDYQLITATPEHLESMYSSLEKVKQLRVNADSVFTSGWDNQSLKAAWFPSVSKLILAINAVTEDIISGTKARLDQTTRSAIEVKHALWEAAEYAGVERGAVNAKISANSFINQDDYVALKRAADKINGAWSIVISHKNEFGSDFENSVKQIEQTYFIKFSEIRKEVLNAGMTQTKYPVTQEQWFEAASDSIKLMNNAHKSVTEFTAQRVISAATSIQMKSWAYLGLVMMGIALICASILLSYFTKPKDKVVFIAQ